MYNISGHIYDNAHSMRAEIINSIIKNINATLYVRINRGIDEPLLILKNSIIWDIMENLNL